MATAAAAAGTSPVIKILIVGDAGVGKTSVIQRYVNHVFAPTHQPTVGVDFFLKEVVLGSTASSSNGGTMETASVRVQLWDIAGQDRSNRLSRVYFKGALGAFVVYDISRPQTFDSAVKWKQELDANVTMPSGKKLPVVLLGNKVDLEVAKVDVTYVDNFVQNHGFIAWSDVSAKDASNVDFELAVECLINKLLHEEDIFEPGARKHAPTALLRYTEKDGRNGGVVRLKAQGGGGKGVRLAKGESDQRTTNSDDARGACCG